MEMEITAIPLKAFDKSFYTADGVFHPVWFRERQIFDFPGGINE
jgi:hypothetical protein